MDVTRDNFEASLDALSEAIADPHFAFWSFDLEFTGLNASSATTFDLLDTPSDRFSKVHESCRRMTVLQYGVCCFAFHPSTRRWTARPFNFWLFPDAGRGSDAVFSCQASSMAFLADCGFDFNKAIRRGVPFVPAAERERNAQRRARAANRPPIVPTNERDKEMVRRLREDVAAWLERGEPPGDGDADPSDGNEDPSDLVRPISPDDLVLEPTNSFLRALTYQTLERETFGATNPPGYLATTRRDFPDGAARVVLRRASEAEIRADAEARAAKAASEERTRDGFAAALRLLCASGNPRWRITRCTTRRSRWRSFCPTSTARTRDSNPPSTTPSAAPSTTPNTSRARSRIGGSRTIRVRRRPGTPRPWRRRPWTPRSVRCTKISRRGRFPNRATERPLPAERAAPLAVARDAPSRRTRTTPRPSSTRSISRSVSIDTPPRFVVPDPDPTTATTTPVGALAKERASFAHEAGYDAYMTGVCFLTMALYGRGAVDADGVGSPRVFPADSRDGDGDGDGIVPPPRRRAVGLLGNAPFADEDGIIPLQHSDVPHVHLRGDDPIPDRSRVVYLVGLAPGTNGGELARRFRDAGSGTRRTSRGCAGRRARHRRADRRTRDERRGERSIRRGQLRREVGRAGVTRGGVTRGGDGSRRVDHAEKRRAERDVSRRLLGARRTGRETRARGDRGARRRHERP